MLICLIVLLITEIALTWNEVVPIFKKKCFDVVKLLMPFCCNLACYISLGGSFGVVRLNLR